MLTPAQQFYEGVDQEGTRGFPLNCDRVDQNVASAMNSALELKSITGCATIKLES